MRFVALILLAATFVLLIAGGLVHSTGSGLACPDWPLCFGTVFPKMEGGVLFEHSHRLIAGSVALLTILLSALLFRKGEIANVKRLGFVAVLLVIFQALLGGLTVIYKLPMMVSTTHLATAMVFFSLITVITVRLWRTQHRGEVISCESAAAAIRALRPWAFLGIVAVYLQVVLGAFVRHTASGGVCPTIPFCEGALWPADAHPAIRLHMAHRLFGVVVGAFVLFLSAWSLRVAAKLRVQTDTRIQLLGRRVGFFGMQISFLVTLQILLGILIVLTHVALFPAVAHLAVGALLLSSLVAFWATVGVSLESQKEHNPPATLARDLLSLAKVRLTLLVLIVTSASFFLAHNHGSFRLYGWTLLGTTLLVMGASFLNALFEKDIDGLMERTKDRPLPAKRLDADKTLIAGVILGFLGVPILTFLVNPLTGFLGALAYISYALLYTPLKAKTSLAALIGAIPGALPPLMGWTAVRGEIDLVGATLFFILFFWQIPHFMAIATYRREEYLRAGIKVMPIAEGDSVTRRLMLRYSAMLVPISLFLVPLGIGGRIYFFTALALGLIYFLWTLYGLRPFSGKGQITWARSLFLYSLVYLPVLFTVLLIDAKLP